MPKLSIIVPVYNVEAYLPACVESILAQTLSDLELILIDDGSPDNCGAVCDAYAAQDCRVRVIHQRNQGVSAARNAGLELLTGDWVGFVDPDDWVAPEMYQRLCMAVTEQKAEIGICGFTFCREDGSLDYSQAVPTGVFPQEEMILSIYGMPNRFHGSMCNKLFSRQLLEDLRFDPSVAIGEDWLMLYHCYVRAERAAAVPECFYHVRARHGSATRKVCAELYIKKLETYLRLYHAADCHSRRIRHQADAKILDACIMNKLEIQKHPDNQLALDQVNKLLRRLSCRALLRGSLSPQKAVYYYKEGLQS